MAVMRGAGRAWWVVRNSASSLEGGVSVLDGDQGGGGKAGEKGEIGMKTVHTG